MRVPPRVPGGEAFDLLFLGDVGADAEGVAAGGALGAADGEAADFLRGGDVAVKERRGEVADGDVVEAVARFVGGKQRGGVDVDGEEVADGVLVFGAREAADGIRAPGLRVLGGGAVEGGFELL